MVGCDDRVSESFIKVARGAHFTSLGSWFYNSTRHRVLLQRSGWEMMESTTGGVTAPNERFM